MHFTTPDFVKTDALISFIFLIIYSHLVATQSAWTKTPPTVIQAPRGSNVTIEWDYYLDGKTIRFAKWGKLKTDTIWDSSYIMRGLGDRRAEVLEAVKDKVKWIANGTMVIMNASLSDTGKYGCSIDLNDGNTMTSYTRLEVFGFSKPNQSESHEESPVEGSKFVLQFDAYANYKPKAIWFKDGQQLNENSTFNFTTETIRSNLSSETLYRFTLIKQIASRNDSGLYEGFIEYINKHVLIRDFLLHIKYPPGASTKFYTSTGSDILLEGSSPVLNCSADSVPASSFEIRKETTPLKNSTEGYYKLVGMSARNEGRYYCTPKNEIGIGRTAHVDVEVGGSPKLNISQTSYYVIHGTNIAMDCMVSGWPKPVVFWLKDGESSQHKTQTKNATKNRELSSQITIKNATLRDAGNYSCQAENMFGRNQSFFRLQVILLVQPNISNAKDVVLSEGRNFSIHYDVEANFPPQVKWFRNGVHIADDGYLMTLEAVGLKSNLTVYRAKLTKSVIRSNESGLYHAMISYGPIVYSLDSFDVKVEALPTMRFLIQDNDFEGWLIPLLIVLVSVILLVFAVFCGISNGRRLRGSDAENSRGGNSDESRNPTGSNGKNSVTQKLSNGVRNVAFEGHNGEVRGTKVGEDELPESDSIFQRDSIYRFTVNPMFTSPDNSIDQRMPFKSAVYLPTNATHETNEASLVFENEDVFEDTYLPPLAQTDEESQVMTAEEEEVIIELPLQEVAMTRTEVDSIDLEAIEVEMEEADQEAEVAEEENAMVEDTAGQEESTQEAEEEVREDALNRSWVLPPLTNSKDSEEATSPFEMYVSDIFDFRTSGY